MARAKDTVFKEAQAAGLVAEDASQDDYTVEALETLLGRGAPAWEGSLSSKTPIVGADGHENLTQADLDARQ